MEGGSTVVEVEVSVDATEIALIVIPGKCHCGNLSFTAFEGIDPVRIRCSSGSFDNEDAATRLARRKRNWIANVEILESPRP
nr:hypothetical protein [Myxococcus xanthus]